MNAHIRISMRHASRSVAIFVAARSTARFSMQCWRRERGRTHMADLIGASLPRPDALGKVTGAARYPADLIQAEMLHLHVVFAQRVHARIVSLDTSAALRDPGVVAVLTAVDVPY